MNFLQPWLLLALPVMALPIIIHLINQRRYQTLPWGAMMFLLAANRMSRGYAKIRQWLILLFRTLAIAALIFAISRPLASGWLGSAGGGGAETAIVLLDRSPSMQQRGSGTPVSKLETGVSQLAGALQTLGARRVILIDSASPQPRELAATESLSDAAEVGPVDAGADLPAMLLAALDYVQVNNLGQTDVWICSDLREGDWKSNDGRWQSIRDAFLSFDNRIRFHLLAYANNAEDNAAIRVTNVRRQTTADGAELLVSLRINRSQSSNELWKTAIEFELEGARSTLNVESSDAVLELVDHRIPLAADRTRGWGRVTIPADANPADNDDYFVFDVEPPRKTLIVGDNPQVVRSLEVAAGIAPALGVTAETMLSTTAELGNVTWEEFGLVIWTSSFPEGSVAAELAAFIARGGQVIVFPTENGGDGSFQGMKWTSWEDLPALTSVENWRGDADLLANTLSGAALPVGAIQVKRLTGIEGKGTTLASLLGGKPLLVRADVELPSGAEQGLSDSSSGQVYFFTTTPRPEDSNLASNGIVLYVAIQRALQLGMESLGSTRQIVAGATPAETAARWQALAGRGDVLSNEQAFRAGVYDTTDRLLAVTRPIQEDQVDVVSDENLQRLFEGLSLARVEGTAGNLDALVQEIWRVFLIAMMLSLLVEAILCLPRVTSLGAINA